MGVFQPFLYLRSLGAILALLCSFSPALAQSFIWPVDNPTITQVYACRHDGGSSCADINGERYQSGINMHTGTDLVGVGAAYEVPVKAVAAGTVEARIAWDGGSRGLGNTIILLHDDGLYTLYGHLDSFDSDLPAVGEPVIQGQELGKMGHSSDFSSRATEVNVGAANAFGIHLHFEVKGNGVLGDSSNTAGVGYVGYTPGHPVLYGYQDPRILVEELSVEEIAPIVLTNPQSEYLNIRSSPGLTYPHSSQSPEFIIGKMGEGQKLIATKRTTVLGGYWYFVDLPSRNLPFENADNNGRHGGWIGGDIPVEEPSTTQGLVTDTFNVRDNAGSVGTNILARVYAGQRFVIAGPEITNSDTQCPGMIWSPIFVPATNQNTSTPIVGWICNAAFIESGTDGVIPRVIISIPNGGQTFGVSPITVSGVAYDPGIPSSGVAAIEVRVNEGAWQQATNTSSWSLLVGLMPGSNKIEARSRDNEGNYSIIDSIDVTYAVAGIDRGLMAYYEFEGNSNDLSPQGNDGVPINVTEYSNSGVSGKALFLNGVDQHISLPNLASFSWTISAWVRQNSDGELGGTGPRATSILDGWSGTELWKISYGTFTEASGSSPWVGYSGPGSYLVASSHPRFDRQETRVYQERHLFYKVNLNDYQWHNILFKHDDETLISALYLDGKAVMTVDFSDIFTYYASNADFSKLQFSVGHNSRHDTYFSGLIDSVRVFDHAISDSQIRSLVLLDGDIISGSVSQAGIGLSGVNMSAVGPRNEATTTLNGSYTFTTLPSDSYTIIPSLAGYVFDPPISCRLCIRSTDAQC